MKGNLRALNQSVSSQVAMLMKDPSKLARRTGVSAEQLPRVLCQAAEPLAQPSNQAKPKGVHGRNVDVAGGAGSAAGGDLGLEAFDDGEFYSQLLKEFLDSSSSAGNLSGSAAYPQVRPTSS